jgi:hypothetical protein
MVGGEQRQFALNLISSLAAELNFLFQTEAVSGRGARRHSALFGVNIFLRPCAHQCGAEQNAAEPTKLARPTKVDIHVCTPRRNNFIACVLRIQVVPQHTPAIQMAYCGRRVYDLLTSTARYPSIRLPLLPDGADNADVVIEEIF